MNGYGIDFGTTNSVMARCESKSGHTLPFTDRSSNLPHPSVIWYRGQDVVVGREAKRQIAEYAGVPGHAFVSSVKRILGKDSSVAVFGENKRVYDVAAAIFRFLRKQAKTEYGDDVENAVVTVPVYFHGEARSDLRRAANAAGIAITTFVHEPFAAVIGHCHAAGRPLEALNDSHVLVFDWGGGTLDITLARVKAGRIYELATAGLNDIAGDHFDSRVESFARSRFLERYGFREDILTLKPGAPARFKEECEETKIRLSTDTTRRIQVADFFEREGGIYHLNEPITRQEFEGLIADDVQAALRQVEKVLAEASVSSAEVDVVLLIGGTSRIPLLRAEMQSRFGARLLYVPNADTIIAEGAAIVARNGWLPYLARPVQIQLADNSLHTVFEQGTVLQPEACRKEIAFYCTDNRDGEARLVVTETRRPGDSSSTQTKHILSIPVSARLPKPYNHERVMARFEIDRDLVLHVKAWSATQSCVSHAPLHDLCFGLEVR